ncbi:MAG: PorP/SprF family type IX secretion system membrane protein [Bacteroidota bacterium]|nr:PorP/SprF family type IX secretion system membrane protein [Bacteroidota bacterium]
MKRFLHIFLLLILSLGESYAQDPQFSQFYAAPLYLGPSMAGASGNGRVNLNYRDQWPKLSGRFVTYALSYDQFIPQYNSGAGILLLRDNAGGGKLTTTIASLNYSYRIKVNRNFSIQPGLQFQYYQKKIDYNKLTFSDQINGDGSLFGTIETPDDQSGHIDFATSVMAYSRYLWFGFTFDHLLKMNPALKDDPRYMPLKTSLYGGIKIPMAQTLLIRDEQSLTVAFNFRHQATLSQLDLGLYYIKLPVMAGIWYRGIPIGSSNSSDAITLLAGVNFSSLTFSYSHDFTVSPLIAATGGAHEIAMSYTFSTRPAGRSFTRRKLGAVPCPRF